MTQNWKKTRSLRSKGWNTLKRWVKYLFGKGFFLFNVLWLYFFGLFTVLIVFVFVFHEHPLFFFLQVQLRWGNYTCATVTPTKYQLPKAGFLSAFNIFINQRSLLQRLFSGLHFDRFFAMLERIFFFFSFHIVWFPHTS